MRKLSYLPRNCPEDKYQLTNSHGGCSVHLPSLEILMQRREHSVPEGEEKMEDQRKHHYNQHQQETCRIRSLNSVEQTKLIMYSLFADKFGINKEVKHVEFINMHGFTFCGKN